MTTGYDHKFGNSKAHFSDLIDSVLKYEIESDAPNTYTMSYSKTTSHTSRTGEDTANRTWHSVWHQEKETRDSNSYLSNISDKDRTRIGFASFSNSASGTTSRSGGVTTVDFTHSGTGSRTEDDTWNDKSQGETGSGDFMSGPGSSPTFTPTWVPGSSSGSGADSGSGTGSWVYTSPGLNGSWSKSSWQKEGARHAELTTGYDGQWTEVTGSGSASVSGSGSSSSSGSETGPVTTKTGYDHHHSISEATFEEHYESDSESESHSDVPDHYYWSHSDFSEERDRTASRHSQSGRREFV